MSKTVAKRHIAGERLRSDTHVPSSTLRFGARRSSHAAPFCNSLGTNLVNKEK